MKLLIRNGKVYDPANGVRGEARSVAVDGGKIVAGGNDFIPDHTIDASGCAVLPGGVDMHCHIAGPAANRARRLLSGESPPVARRAGFRSGSGGLVPSTFITGYRYSALGYTTAVDAAVAPSSARQCHLELEDTPNIDKAFLLLLANNEHILDLIAREEREAAGEAAAALLSRTGAFGIKAVSPGGVSLWKSESRRIESLGEPIGKCKASPRAILETLAAAASSLDLPHPIHIHANRLGMPGNIETTLETSRILEGRRHHLTHVQFHAYGSDENGAHASAAPRFAEHFNKHPELSADVGQVMFQDALTLSADLALEHVLWQLTGKRYATVEIELETGCGMVPFRYRPKSKLHALQWAVGMEIFLLCDDPWRLALSTDHPNGGSFLTYPKVIALLMQKDLRRDALHTTGDRPLPGVRLPDITREYTLEEITIITRAAPARILGLEHKGHLGAGADADITIYDELPDREAMFSTPRFVIKGGAVVVEKGELRDPARGETFRADVRASPDGEKSLEDWFKKHGTYQWPQMGLGKDELLRRRAVKGKPPR